MCAIGFADGACAFARAAGRMGYCARELNHLTGRCETPLPSLETASFAPSLSKNPGFFRECAERFSLVLLCRRAWGAWMRQRRSIVRVRRAESVFPKLNPPESPWLCLLPRAPFCTFSVRLCWSSQRKTPRVLTGARCVADQLPGLPFLRTGSRETGCRPRGGTAPPAASRRFPAGAGNGRLTPASGQRSGSSHPRPAAS